MIPKNAKRVFEGILFDVYQWPQKLFDDSITTFEMLKRLDTAEIIATKDGKIMLQEQEQPGEGRSKFLCLPGGRIEKGEESLVGAKRELLEESGYISNKWSLFHEVQPMYKMDWKIYVYVARDCEFIQKQHLDAGEKIQIRWVTLDELLDLVDKGHLAWIEQDLRVQLVRAKYNEPAKEELACQLFL
ncbi:NUDIX hydrolase [Candidatus Uhrbacteria bacterium]|nr:NUDIX hydrolase [Candidatus Uhrbacteria bacterium]